MLQQADLDFNGFRSSVQMNQKQHLVQNGHPIVLNKDLEDAIDQLKEEKREGIVADREQTISDISSLSIDADKQNKNFDGMQNFKTTMNITEDAFDQIKGSEMEGERDS